MSGSPDTGRHEKERIMSRYNDGRSRTAEEFVIRTGDLRLSVLSERILRVERSKDGVFTDAPTQTVVNRSFSKPQFEVNEMADKVWYTGGKITRRRRWR